MIRSLYAQSACWMTPVASSRSQREVHDVRQRKGLRYSLMCAMLVLEVDDLRRRQVNGLLCWCNSGRLAIGRLCVLGDCMQLSCSREREFLRCRCRWCHCVNNVVRVKVIWICSGERR